MGENLPHLSSRLALVASFVRRGVPVSDIGTDHAYLPVYLVNSGANPAAVAGDVKKGPFERAMMTAQAFCAEDKITFLLTDGLEGIGPQQADDVVIAGMGGELIATIIDRCPWIKDPKKHLVLQPMTAQEELRRFLCENGFSIEKEAVAAEKHDRKLYLAMSVYYSGTVRQADEVYCIAGELQKAKGENVRAYLEAKARSLYKKADGLACAKENNAAEAEKSRSLADKLMEIRNTVKRE